MQHSEISMGDGQSPLARAALDVRVRQGAFADGYQWRIPRAVGATRGSASLLGTGQSSALGAADHRETLINSVEKQN